MGGTQVIKLGSPRETDSSRYASINNPRQPQMSDMIALLNDLSYIPPNNEQNEPIQEDIGETSNEPTQAKRNEFEELYASANEELYPGCDYVTRLDFMAKFTYFRVRNDLHALLESVLGGSRLRSPPVDGRAWKNFDTKYPNFAKEPEISIIGMLRDGFNRSSSFMLTLLIPGPKSPGKDIDVYLRPLIDDLKVLWALKGVETIDVATGQKFNMRAMVLWTINDFPARSSLSGWSGQGYKACPTCNEDTPSVRVKFPNKDMKEEFPNWFGSQIRQRHVDNDPGVSATSELFALACGPTPTPISVNSCVVNGVRFVVHSRDERRTTQNNGICSPGGKDREMYYGQLQEILEFSYLSFKVVLFRVKWFDTSNEGRKVKHLVLRNNMTQILTKGETFKDDQYILATQVKQWFYLKDMARRQPHWKVVEHVNHKMFSNGGVIVVEEDPDVIHFNNSSDLSFSTSLNDLDNATLHIDG
ncbi:RNA-directed DNA polymerase, eukaryota [Tanacetum coccineum]